jgi:hypothetical protein
MTRRVSLRGGEPSNPDGAGSLENEQGKNGRKLDRRALLTRGGVVAAGVVGAGAVGAAVAGPASAQATTAVNMNTVNDAGTSSTVTELDADNNTTPAFIVANSGTDTETIDGQTGIFAGPNLRLTPASSTATTYTPTPSTVGGDLTATYDGTLWFTHDFTLGSSPGIVPAPVHTEATSNVYVQLLTNTRVLDTRYADLRTNIVNPSGNLDSHGRLLKGAVIAINLDSLVYFAEAVFGNVTVTDTAAAGFVIVWAGATSVPNISTVNFGANATLSNFFSSGISDDAPAANNVVAVYAEETTHVILDVAGFALPGFEYLMPNVQPASSLSTRNSRLLRAQAAMRRDQAARRNAKRA